MRLTDDRYASERNQFELALRMISHEARTRTIRECTRLSDDRIRKLFDTYFRNSAGRSIRRHRGKSPRQVARFVKNPVNQLQSTTLVALFCSGRLLSVDINRRLKPRWPQPNVEYGHRVCRAFETYCLLHSDARLSFEWTWNLLQTISRNDELFMARCSKCSVAYVQDAYALDHQECPSCEIARHSQRRTGAAALGRQ